jgi:hypothetical protein
MASIRFDASRSSLPNVCVKAPARSFQPRSSCLDRLLARGRVPGVHRLVSYADDLLADVRLIQACRQFTGLAQKLEEGSKRAALTSHDATHRFREPAEVGIKDTLEGQLHARGGIDGGPSELTQAGCGPSISCKGVLDWRFLAVACAR